MIFTIINNSVDKSRKTLALFNKDWNTYKTNWEKGFSQNGVVGGIKSLFQKQEIPSVVSKDQLQILRNWNNAVEHGCKKQETFNRIIADADENTKMYFSSLNKGKGSLEGLKAAQNTAEKSTIGLTIAQTALNMAISIGLTAAIILAIKGFDKLINSAKRASEAADEAFSKTNEKVLQNKKELKSLDELIDKYKELKSSENIDLDDRKQIKELQNDIADLVGVQAKNLDLVNGKLDEEIKKLDEISAKEAKMAYETATANYINSKKASLEASGDDSFLFMDGYAYVGKREKEAEKALHDAGFVTNVKPGGLFNSTLFIQDTFRDDNGSIKFVNGAQERADYLQEMINVLEQNGQRATELYAGLVTQRDSYLKYIEDQQASANSIVDSWITYSKTSNQTLSKINVDSMEAFEEYRQTMLEEARNDDSIEMAILDGVLSEDDLEKAIDDFMATSTDFSYWYEQWINNVQNISQEGNEVSSYVPSLSAAQIEKINEYQSKLKDLYEALNLIRSGTATSTDIDAIIDKFPELSNDTGDLETAINSLINNALRSMNDIYGDAIDNVAEFAVRQEALTHSIDTTASAIDNITSSYDSLNKAIEEYNENGYVSLSTLEQIMKLEPKYLAALMDEEGNIVSNTYAYRDLVLMKLKDYELEALKEANLTNAKLKQDFENGSISKVEYDAGLRASDSDLMTKLTFINSARENIDKIMVELNKSETESTSDFNQQIDWTAQSISALENEVSRLESVLSNTESWEAQKRYIEELGVALDNLSEGYSKEWRFYKSKYNETLTSGILADKGLTEELRKKIESGEVFDIEKFVEENVKSGDKSVTQQIYEAIQEAICYWNQTNDAAQNKIKVLADIEANKERDIALDREIDEAEIARLEQARTNLENTIDFRNGEGTLEHYNGLIANEAEITKNLTEDLIREKALLEEIRKEHGENSNAFYEQEQVVYKIENALSECKKRTLEWGQAITELSLKEFKDEIEGLNKELESVEGRMDEVDSIIAGAQAYIQDQIDVQEELKEGIQDQIDALQKTNDERERALALEKAKYELERAQRHRTVKVYKGEDRGFVYEQDQDAVRDAQDNLSKLEFENVIHQLEKQIEYYDDIIKDLQEMKDAWGSIKQDAQDALDIEKAINAIGVDGIFNMDVVADFTSEYESLLRTQEHINDEIENLTDLYETLKRAVDEYKFGLIEVEECTERMNEAFVSAYGRYEYNEFGDFIGSNREKIQEAIDNIKEINNIPATLEDLFGRIGGVVDNFAYNTDYSALESTTDKIVGIVEGFYNDMYDEFEQFDFTGLITDEQGIKRVLNEISTLELDSWRWEEAGNTFQSVVDILMESNPAFAEMASSAEATAAEVGDSAKSTEEQIKESMEEITQAFQKGTEEQKQLIDDYTGQLQTAYSDATKAIISDMDTQFKAFGEKLILEAENFKAKISGILADVKKDMGELEEAETKVQTYNSNNASHTPGQKNIELKANGGMLTGKDKELDKLARSLGEDHITLLGYKEGERVLTPVQNELWEKMIANAGNLVMNPPTYDMFNLKHEYVPLNRSAQVNIGDVNITCSGVTSQQVAKQIGDELKRNFGNMTLDALQMSGKK